MQVLDKYPVYALGIASQPADHAGALPLLASSENGAVQYPIVTPDQAPASLAALATQLANQYIIGYVPGQSAEPETHPAVDVRLTPPVGLPPLTARVSSGTR